MAETALKKVWTEREYLELEQTSDVRHEFYGGEIFAMSGGSIQHATIISNLHGLLFQALSGSGCKPFVGVLRVKIEQTGLWTYPDLAIVCGDQQILNEDTLLNPTVIIEVLSPSTESYDRVAKFDHYSTIPALRSYILVSQAFPRIDMFSRNQPAERWDYQAIKGLNSSLHIPAASVTLAVQEIYMGVQFPPDIHPLPPV